MPLPKIDLPIHTITLPTSKKKVSFRPFVTREEKILQQAAQSDDEMAIVSAIKQVITNCCIDTLDLDNLPLVDLQYFILKLRAKSVGEIIEARYECQHLPPQSEVQKPCGNLVVIPVNIDQIEPTMPEKDLSVVWVSVQQGIVMKLRYPTFEVLKEILKDKDSDSEFRVIAKCVESVSKDQEVFDRFTDDEIVEFLKDLKRETFKQVQDFFDNQPELTIVIPFKCNKCGYSTKITLSGFSDLTDFFD